MQGERVFRHEKANAKCSVFLLSSSPQSGTLLRNHNLQSQTNLLSVLRYCFYMAHSGRLCPSKYDTPPFISYTYQSKGRLCELFHSASTISVTFSTPYKGQVGCKGVRTDIPEYEKASCSYSLKSHGCSKKHPRTKDGTLIIDRLMNNVMCRELWECELW